VIANARKHKPQAKLTGVMVSEMVTGAVETLLGMVNDEVFGPVVVFGMGGVLAEVLHDVSYRVAPFDREEARNMISELRTCALFDGVRGSPPSDVEALVDALVKVSQFAWAQRDTLTEVDINPLLVRPKGQGVIAADAVLVAKFP
jgi:acyl-CoA synthetase (NDP forming)